jgi:hypothetical protein
MRRFEMRSVCLYVAIDFEDPDPCWAILLGDGIKDQDAGFNPYRCLNLLLDRSLVVLQLSGIDLDFRQLHVLRLRFLGARRPAH